MTEEELNRVRESARTGDARGELELAQLYAGDYFKYRSQYTLDALCTGMMRVYDRAVNACCPDAANELIEYYELFKAKKTSDTLNQLIVYTIQVLTELAPTMSYLFTMSLTEGMQSLAATCELIVEKHFPEWRKQSKLSESISRFAGSPDIESFYAVIDAVRVCLTVKGDNTVIEALMADALSKGVTEALTPLARRLGYKTAGCTFSNNTVFPQFDDKGNHAYPSILTGVAGNPIKVTGDRKILSWKMIDFFTQDVSVFNHYLLVEYNENNQSARKAAMGCQQAMLASVLAWIGPGKFTLDVVDYEHTGIGAYPAQWLPEKTVKIITNAAEWENELDSIERIIEKRSRQMQSIMVYNQANADMIEPFKVIVVQDHKGALTRPLNPLPEHPDQKEKEQYETEKRNAERFLHLLERGYRYGLIFIVSSGQNQYKSDSRVLINGITYASNPFNIFSVKDVANDGPDWLMKWLSGGGDPAVRRQKAQAGEQLDGAEGILTTEVADDGTEIEFRLDTVSHTHAFVIGKTGSGKSVLLHNIITGLVNSYGPDDLMLYLLDLKMGGVEFNRYRRLPHLRSLLVDNSDIQIVLEIMRDIDLMMRERGKEFRNAGVSNVKEYNRANPGKKMSQVIVVIDECHAIFSMGSGRGASKDQREITERLAKIAKEGRSQGIHLIFATQTLSGSEIPADIQKNITDYYLLKCAPSDSEQLVRGSSNKTEALPVGKVYYYHADKQALFQGTYNDNQACEELISQSLSRYAGKPSHGQFYFNGAQTFELNDSGVNAIAADDKRGVHGTPGRMINLQQTPIMLNLTRDYSENVVITGINAEEQLSRTSLAMMASQIAVAARRNEKLTVNVINCLDRDSRTSAILSDLADARHINLYSPADSETMLKRLCDQVSQKSVPQSTLLYVFGQERFGELKRDQKFSNDEPMTSDSIANDIFGGLSFTPVQSTGGKHNCDSFRKALIYLLENGPLAGVNTVIQLDKPDKLLFEDFISAKTVSARFKHIIILRSEARAAMSLGLNDEVNVETLSADIERLRAYYYCDDDGSTRLFSPYEFVSNQLLDILLNK